MRGHASGCWKEARNPRRGSSQNPVTRGVSSLNVLNSERRKGEINRVTKEILYCAPSW